MDQRWGVGISGGSVERADSQPRDLAGKVALVIGGSRNQGAAIAENIASRGADTVISYASSGDAAHVTSPTRMPAWFLRPKQPWMLSLPAISGGNRTRPLATPMVRKDPPCHRIVDVIEPGRDGRRAEQLILIGGKWA